MTTMDIGPVQLIVLGFDRPSFGGGIAAQLSRLKEQGVIRVIDALVVNRNSVGEVTTLQATDLGLEEAERFGAVIGGLIGLGAAGEQGVEEGAQIGIEEIRARDGHILDPSETWDVMDDIPVGSAAALVLIEHQWAIPLRDAVRAEGGRPIGDVWLHPTDLVAAGLMAAEVARETR